MVSEGEIWKLEKDLCRCCHAEGNFDNLANEQEIYSDMLRYCFDIDVTPVPGALCAVTYTICPDCILKLRDASAFKKQVQLCEEKFLKFYYKKAITVNEQDEPDQEVKDEPEVYFDMDFPKELSPDEDMPTKGKYKIHDYEDDIYNNDQSEDEEEEEKVIKKIPTATKKKKEPQKQKTRAKEKQKEKKTQKEKEKEKEKQKETDETQKEGDDGAQRKETAPSVQTMRQEMKHRPRRGEKYDPNLTIVIENKKVSYKCNTCSKEFQKRGLYTQHRNYVHLKKRPKVFGCNLCDERVPHNKRALHMETHGLKAPTCGACGKKFSFPFLVERHIRIYHMFEKDHKCPECGLEFATQNKLQQHRLTHTDKRPYPCEICGKSYRSRGNLRTHMKMHLNIRNHVCSVCEEAFVQHSSLKYHMNSRHPDYSGPLKRKQDNQSDN